MGPIVGGFLQPISQYHINLTAAQSDHCVGDMYDTYRISDKVRSELHCDSSIG